MLCFKLFCFLLVTAKQLITNFSFLPRFFSSISFILTPLPLCVFRNFDSVCLKFCLKIYVLFWFVLSHSAFFVCLFDNFGSLVYCLDKIHSGVCSLVLLLFCLIWWWNWKHSFQRRWRECYLGTIMMTMTLSSSLSIVFTAVIDDDP